MGINLDSGSSLKSRNLLRGAVFFVLVAIGVWAFYLVSSDKKTSLEADLLALILTSVSIAASWLASKVYAEVSASQSLRDYGVQIARGVIVLQSEIKLLSSWVARKRVTFSENQSPESLDAAFDHVQETLTTFRFQTDAALSGIAGVIGDALSQYDSVMDEIRKTREKAAAEADQIEKHMRGASDSSPRSESPAQHPGASPATSQENANDLAARLDELAKQTEEKIAALSRRSSLPIFEESPDRHYEVACPACSTINSGEMPDRAGETKAIRCTQCQSRFNIHSTTGRQLLVRLISVGSLHNSTPPPVQPMSISASSASADLVAAAISDWPFLVPSDQLKTLIASALKLQSAAVDAGMKLSQTELRDRLFADTEVSGAGISRKRVRGFVQALFYGRLFLYDPNVTISPTSPFENVFSEGQVISAYVRACAHHVGKQVSIDVAPIHLVNLLLSSAGYSDAELRLAVDAASNGLTAGIRKRNELQQLWGSGVAPSALGDGTREPVDKGSFEPHNDGALNSQGTPIITNG